MVRELLFQTAQELGEGEDHMAMGVILVVIAAGLASATTAVVTSVFGIPGTLIGGILTAMVTTASSTIYKAYLDSIKRILLLADRPAPPPFALLADRPAPPPL